MLTGMASAKFGRPAGSPTRGAFADFLADPTTPRRVATSLEPEVLLKLIAQTTAMDVSVAWWLKEVVERVLSDFDPENPIPDWFEGARLVEFRPAAYGQAVSQLAATGSNESSNYAKEAGQLKPTG